jgi:hypothetical protein
MRLLSHRRIPFLVGLACAGLTLLTGCNREGIRTYEVPRDKQRLLAAIALQTDSSWFFKLMGNVDHVTENSEAFWQFVHTVRFQDQGSEPVTWTAPEEWKYEKGKDLRYATFRIPHGQEVTVFRFGAEGNQWLANVNRWRGQLKLPPINGRQLFEQCKEEKIGGTTFLLVDLQSARTDAHPADAAQDPDEPVLDEKPEGKGITYTTPSGWTVSRFGSKMRVASFEIEEGGKKVEVSVIPLSGAAGGLAMNVNRWREEVGLPDLGQTEILATAKKIDMGGVESDYVDLTGDKNNKRTLGVICPKGGQTWFVKMWGPGDAVANQKTNFESFVRSIRFGGGK